MKLRKKHFIILLGVAAGGVSLYSLSINSISLGTLSLSGDRTLKTGVCSAPYVVTAKNRSIKIGGQNPNNQTSFKSTTDAASTSDSIVAGEPVIYQLNGVPRDTLITLSGKNIKDTWVQSLFARPQISFFTDSTCTTVANKLVITKGTTDTTFYTKITTPGAYTIVANAASYKEATFTLGGIPAGGLGGGNSGGETSFMLTPTVGAIDVTKFSSTVAPAKGDGVTDDTKAFNEAIRLASVSTTKPFSSGPTGVPQGVVYVPAKTYRVRDVQFMDNVRMEIDAGAVIMQTQSKPNKNAVGINLFTFGPTKDRNTVPSKQLVNVSLVGVGSSTTMAGEVKPVPYPGWSLDNSFTINIDPVTTGASQNLKPIRVMYVNGLLIQNVFTVGNNSDSSNKFSNNVQNPGDGVNTESATIVFQNQTSSGGTDVFYGPTNVTTQNIYTTKAIHGYGATQIQSGRTLKFKNIFSEGGIALRLESDVVGVDTLNAHSCVKEQHGGGGDSCTCGGAYPKCPLAYFSEINGVTADTIQCLNGHAALSLLPHNQTNKNVNITNVRSDNCFNAIETGTPGDERLANAGSFSGVTISGVTVVGSNVNGSGTKAQGMPKAFGISNGQSWAPDVMSSHSVCVADQNAVPISSVGTCLKSGDFTPKGPACDKNIEALCISDTGLKAVINQLQNK